MIVYGHYIEAQRALFDVAFGQEARRGADHNALLFPCHTEFRQRWGVFFHSTRSNFDNRQRLAVAANQVQFTFDSARSVILREENVAVAPQIPIVLFFA